MGDEATIDVLCMDAGQTGIRAELRIEGEVQHEMGFPGVVTSKPAIPQLASAAATTLGVAGIAVETVAIGSSGLPDDADPDELLAELGPLGVRKVVLAHDSITSYLGALGEHPGVVVAGGTGVVTLALGETGLARVDGWGHLIGDAGSGFWIGRAALEMVMRAHDGRGPATALTGLVQQDFDDLETAYLELQADPNRVSRIASYAKLVAGLSMSDEVAGSITQGAAYELANSALAGLHRVGEDTSEQPLVAVVGNLFKSETLFNAFGRAVSDKLSAARVVRAKGTSMDGAARLAGLREGSPLAGSVRIAQ